MEISYERRNAVEQFLSDWMTREGCPGVSFAIVESNDVYATGLGSRDIRLNSPATAETLYGIASCTKSLTAIGVLQLADKGCLDLDDPVRKHVSFDIWADADPAITIHDLLTHSSGLPGDGSSFLMLNRKLGLSDTTVPLGSLDDLRRFAEESLNQRAADSGETFFYYNTGYTLLGEVISYHSGNSYTEYVEEKILEPLNMTRSTFSKKEVCRDPNVTTPYLTIDSRLESTEFPFHGFTHAAGGLLSSVSDFANYLQMQLSDGSFGGNKILSEEAIKRSRQGYIQWDYGLSGSDNRYGYGWTTKQFMDERVCSHVGDLLVSSSYMGFLPEQDFGVVVLANISPEYLLQSVGEGAISILLGGKPTQDVSFWSLREKLSRLTGRYESYRGVLTGSIIQKGTILKFESDGVPEVSFRMVAETTDHDDFTFKTFTEEGHKKPLRVDVNNNNVDVYLGRWRLQKVTGD